MGMFRQGMKTIACRGPGDVGSVRRASTPAEEGAAWRQRPALLDPGIERTAHRPIFTSCRLVCLSAGQGL